MQGNSDGKFSTCFCHEKPREKVHNSSKGFWQTRDVAMPCCYSHKYLIHFVYYSLCDVEHVCISSGAHNIKSKKHPGSFEIASRLCLIYVNFLSNFSCMFVWVNEKYLNHKQAAKLRCEMQFSAMKHQNIMIWF